jgi:putative molybdopterin biosynthesis protein
VATAIIQGRADVGLSLEAVARMFDLDFIPVGEEIYDFAVRRERLEKPAVRRLLDALASREFAELLPKELPGYRTLPETGKQVYP